MKLFFKNIKKYYKYALYSAKAELKAEVANSYLNWLWWILDPICFMLVYTFMVQIVFKTSEQYFPVFVFVGLSCWDFFNRCVSGSVKLIHNNRAIVSKVYLPKYILLLSKSFVYVFKALISFALVFILMIIFKVPITIHVLNFFLIFVVLYFISNGISSILLHFGVFVQDLSNIVTILLKLMFYLSGIFYSIPDRIPSPFKEVVLNLNPIAFIINEFRQVLIYGQMPNYLGLGIWFAISCVLIYIGVSVISKYENSYVKVL